MTPLRHTTSLAGLLLLLLDATAGAQDRRGPFTAPPRSVRSRDVDQQHVKLELKIDLDAQQFRGRATLALAAVKPIRSVELDAVEMKIEKVTLVDPADAARSRELKFETRAGELAVQLDREYKIDEKLTLAVDYQVSSPQQGAHFVKPDPNEPGRMRMMWTQGEPEYARYWFPCVDTPSDRLTSETHVTVPKECFVLSNGVLEGNQENPDGTRTFHWSQKDSHVTYLVSVVAGEFEPYEQSWDGVPVVSYVPKGKLTDAERSFKKTPAMVAWFSQKIGYRYPWPKYTQICVDEYVWGGMEHTSATTLNVNTLHDERAHLDVSSDNLVSHELAHQWWGDLLTCKDWGELWLNESFATYFANLWTEHDLGEDEAAWERYGEAQEYMAEDSSLYRRPIVSYRYNDPEVMFDRHTYPKGGRVLHMLRYVLGDELFWKSMRLYAQKNRFRTVEAADLRIAIEEATGQGLNWFFDQWLHHGGHPEFDVAWTWDETAKTVTLSVKQKQKVDELTPLFRMPVDVELATPSGVLLRQITVSKADEQFHFQLDARPTRVCFDPKDWILKRISFDKPKEELLDQLARDPHVMCRVWAAQDLARFAPQQDARDALLRAAKTDNFWAVRQEAVKALGKFSGDELRDGLVEIALRDPKSLVRRAAIGPLGNFAHDSTRQALRVIIKDDRSYYAVAEALRALVKVDRDHCKADLLAALDQPSYEQVVLWAACDGLVELKSQEALAKLTPFLDRPLTVELRAAVIGALARLKPDDPKLSDSLRKLLDSSRSNVRRNAFRVLADVGDPTAIEPLLARREKEHRQGMLEAIDDAVRKLRARQNNIDQIRKELESLRSQNRALEDRIKKLEDATKK